MAKLVEVYSARSEGEARMIWGLLESHGIRCTMAGEAVSVGKEAGEGKQASTRIRLLVPFNEVEKAQKVLELLSQ